MTGAFTVTVTGTQNAKSITFEEGTVTLSGGTINLGTGLASGGTNNNQLITTAPAIISSVLAGSNGLAKAGINTLTLSGANTFTGSVAINGGALIANSLGALGATTNTVLINRGGSLVANFTSGVDQALLSRVVPTSTGGIALASGQTNTNALTFTGFADLTLGANGTATYSGALTPNGTTYRFGGGNGTLTVTSAIDPTYAIAVLNPATIVLTNSANNLGQGGITISSNGTGSVGSSGNVFLRLGANKQYSDTATLLIDANNGQNTGFALNNFTETLGPITVQTTSLGGAVIQTGATGVLVLNGTLSLNNNRNATGNTANNVLITGSGGTATRTFDGTLDLGGVNRTINVASAFAQLDDDAAIETNIRNGGINKTGGQILFLRGFGSTYAGGTTINGGGINVNNDRALGAVPSSPAAGNVTFAADSGLQSTGSFAINANRGFAINSGVNAVFDARGAADLMRIDSVISGAGNFVRGQTPSALLNTSLGTVILNATNTYLGTTSIASGTLMLGAGGTTGMVPGAINFTAATGVTPVLNFNRRDNLTFAANITNTGMGLAD